MIDRYMLKLFTQNILTVKDKRKKKGGVELKWA